MGLFRTIQIYAASFAMVPIALRPSTLYEAAEASECFSIVDWRMLRPGRWEVVRISTIYNTIQYYIQSKGRLFIVPCPFVIGSSGNYCTFVLSCFVLFCFVSYVVTRLFFLSSFFIRVLMRICSFCVQRVRPSGQSAL